MRKVIIDNYTYYYTNAWVKHNDWYLYKSAVANGDIHMYLAQNTGTMDDACRTKYKVIGSNDLKCGVPHINTFKYPAFHGESGENLICANGVPIYVLRYTELAAYEDSFKEEIRKLYSLKKRTHVEMLRILILNDYLLNIPLAVYEKEIYEANYKKINTNLKIAV